ncbi:MAG: GNAT family N-acetyltransferase [Thermomicrobiales bacterium]|nr:GNAT family N-acetyltransferase [Thermomicrobiales bacterium]
MYSLRPATSDDHERLRLIHDAGFHDVVDQVWGWDDDYQIQRWANYMAAVVIDVIEVDSEIAGFIDLTKNDDHWYVTNIVIAPEQQRKGIGSAVLRDVIAQAQSAGMPLRLQVMKLNPEAHALYERLGFVVNGEIETHFKMEYVGQ